MNRLWHRLVTGDSGIAAQGAARTGFLESMVLLGLTSAGVSGAALGIATTLLTTLITTGISVGLSFLANALFGPSQAAPRPEDMQQSSRQPTQPRSRHYGRVKVSGPWVFAEASGGDFYKVVAIGQGPIDAIEEFWIDDNRVTLSGGVVQEDPWRGQCTIDYRLGAATETVYSGLNAAYPVSWSADHRGDGIASLYIRQYAVAQDVYLRAFPNGINTNYRVVMRGSKVWSPADGAVAWNDNAAAVIRDYMVHADGMRLPESVVSTPLAAAGWVEAYSRAAQAIGRAAGDSEARYRLWGSYMLSERPADVLGRMLECCDGRLAPTPDGGLTLDIGRWSEPAAVIDEDAIVGFSDLSRGRDILTAANTVRATFLDPESDYQAADADPWVDAVDASVRGEIAIDKRFEMAPSHSQCRRLMKLAAYRANPRWTGTFRCNLRALAAFGERFVRIRYRAFLIDEVFEVSDFRFDIGPGGILQGVTLSVQSMPGLAYEWDAGQEEGDAPIADESEGSGVPAVEAPDVTIISGPKASIALEEPPSVLYRNQVRYKKTADGDDHWTLVGEIGFDETAIETGSLASATSYEFQRRLVTVALGIPGPWSDSTIAST